MHDARAEKKETDLYDDTFCDEFNLADSFQGFVKSKWDLSSQILDFQYDFFLFKWELDYFSCCYVELNQ